jgi:ribosome-associated protein
LTFGHGDTLRLLSRQFKRGTINTQHKAHDRCAFSGFLMTIFHIPTDEVELTAVRSQGPGGQNVNKVSSAIQLRFDVGASSLPPELKERVLALRDHRLTKGGVVVIKSQEHRSQDMNRMAALLRLHDLLELASLVQKPRKPTRPTRSSQAKRVESKVKRGQTKALRGKANFSD